jgi:outer membrane protein TolC
MKLGLAMSALALLGACADTAVVQRASDAKAGFAFIADGGDRATGARAAWSQSAAEVAATEARAKALVAGRTIHADTAVQVALMNNRALQAAYAELGLSAADLWEVAQGPRPVLEIGLAGIGEAGLIRSLEATVTAAILEAATRKPRTQLAETRFRQAQLEALQETIALAAQTRRAWIDAVAGFERAALIARSLDTAEAASELAAELGRTGAMSRADQAREHVFTAELAAERTEARLEAQLAKEKLTRLMGLYGSDTHYSVPDRLPSLPGRQPGRSDIEALALQHRTDLAIGKIELEAIAQEFRLTTANRRLESADITAGLEVERNDEGETEVGPLLAASFEIPLYNAGPLTSRRGALEYSRAAHALAQQAVNARSEARSAHAEVTGSYNIARHWRDEVLPLRRQIDAEALKSYSGMLTSTFELIADARDGLEAQLATAEARADFWRAASDLRTVIWAPIEGEEQ